MKNSKSRFWEQKWNGWAGLRGKNRWRIWTKDLSPDLIFVGFILDGSCFIFCCFSVICFGCNTERSLGLVMNFTRKMSIPNKKAFAIGLDCCDIL